MYWGFAEGRGALATRTYRWVLVYYRGCSTSFAILSLWAPDKWWKVVFSSVRSDTFLNMDPRFMKRLRVASAERGPLPFV